ncbi:MAG: hypothetical protein OEM07_02155, partial [Gammaproteobacteria bacterium]|nr:hypothetical protein [Gammaproteobacteria bacterium]
MSVVQKIIVMLLLKTAPQDLPYSTGLMARVIFLNLISGVIIGGADDPALAFSQMLLSVLILLFFSYVVLSSLKLMARFVQTVTALFGTGIIFNLLFWPIFSFSQAEQLSDFSLQVISSAIL